MAERPWRFEWDPAKAASNAAKHDVGFPEAGTVFDDPYVLVRYDARYEDEDRYLALGLSDRGRVLIVAATRRGERIRLISARRATRHERAAYQQRRP